MNRQLALLVCLTLSLSNFAAGQTATNKQSADDVIRINVDLVQVDVTVTDKESRRPQLQSRMRPFRDGRLAHSGRPADFNPGEQPNAKRLVVVGSFRPGTELAPGDYTLRIVVFDRLAKDPKHAVATRWTDFEPLP